MGIAPSSEWQNAGTIEDGGNMAAASWQATDSWQVQWVRQNQDGTYDVTTHTWYGHASTEDGSPPFEIKRQIGQITCTDWTDPENSQLHADFEYESVGRSVDTAEEAALEAERLARAQLAFTAPD